MMHGSRICFMHVGPMSLNHRGKISRNCVLYDKEKLHRMFLQHSKISSLTSVTADRSALHISRFQ